MIEKRTVFVLGAGASCPYGFPTAWLLRQDILSTFADHYGHYLSGLGHDRMVERIPQGYPLTSGLQPFITSFEKSGTESIDLFLSGHPQFQQIGKMAISLSVLHAERFSGFNEKAKKRECDWYFYLFNRIRRELAGKDGYKEFGKNNIAFVTFNYDRSLDYFLFTSLLNSFEGADPQKARGQILQVPIIHVYGQIGPLEWQSQDEKMVLPYGTDIDNFSELDLLSLTKNLHVMHEERTHPQLDLARKEISNAERLFFLGFGYAKENLEALGFPDVLQRDHQIYGTALDWTVKEISGITDYFVDGLQRSGRHTLGVSDQVQIRNCDCVQLLREFL